MDESVQGEGQTFRRARQMLGLTQEGVARAAKMDQADISRLETGRRTITPAMRVRLLAALAAARRGRP